MQSALGEGLVLPAFPLQEEVSLLLHHQPILVAVVVVVLFVAPAAVRVQHRYWVVCWSLVSWILLLAALERLK